MVQSDSDESTMIMYGVVYSYGIMKYSVDAAGAPTLLGPVLSCRDHQGERMNALTLVRLRKQRAYLVSRAYI
eukprot:SAG31_NODE_1089_length_9972_cov_4.602856_13_plen_72_part_00